MSKATLIIYGKNNSTTTIYVQFNPAELNISQSASGQFVSPNETSSVMNSNNNNQNNVAKPPKNSAASYSFSLILDAFTKGKKDGDIISLDENQAGDIIGDVKELQKVALIAAETHHSPKIAFEWGNIKIRGYAQSVNTKFTMFSASGALLRATVDLTIIAEDGEKIPLESPDRTKRRELKQGAMLYSMAYECYSDCNEWRVIAAANGLNCPRRAPYGVPMNIPPLF